MMLCWCTLVLLSLVPVVTGDNSGVKFKLTQKGLDLVAEKAMEMLKHMDIPDQTIPIPHKTIPLLQYSFTGIKIDLVEPHSVQTFDENIGVNIQIKSDKIQVTGNLLSGQSSSPLKLIADTMVITATVPVKSETGHLQLRIKDCKVEFGTFKANRTGSSLVDGIAWLIKKIHLIASIGICSMTYNLQLAKLNAAVSAHGIDFSVGPTVISKNSIELSLKDIFIHMGQPKETRLSPTDFTLPSQNTKMFYIGISAFTINSIIADIHNSGLLIYRITDDMVPSWILSTTTFGAYIPEISKKYPDQKMMLEIQTVKEPVIKFEANKLILEVLGTMAAFVIQSDENLSSLFVLELKCSVSAQVYGTELNLPLKLTPNKIEASIKNSNFPFEVTKLNSFLDIIKIPVFTLINAHLAKGYLLPGYPLPFSLGEMHLANTQVECITSVNTQDYLLIGTDVHIQENDSPQHS